MNGAVNPGMVAMWTSVGVALAAASFPILMAMRARKVSGLFGIACVAMSFDALAIAVFGSLGPAYIGLAKAALLLMAAFALVGIIAGSVRGLRSGRTNSGT